MRTKAGNCFYNDEAKYIRGLNNDLIVFALANGWRDDSAKSALSVKHSRGCPLHSSKQRRRNLTNTSDATVSPGATPHSSFCTCAALANIAPSITSALSVLYLIAKCRSSLVVRHVPMLAEVINQTANSTQDAPGLESNALSFTTGAIEACFSHLAGNSSKKGAHFRWVTQRSGS